MSNGRLILVPTPIGNLSDITRRAVEVLENADVIICEDTRHSGMLLKHLGIQKQLISYHTHNEHGQVNSLLRRIEEGQVLALITDAGTPGISDPGFLIARECIARGLEVQCLPGPVAFVPALVMSGLPADRFVFEGFLPVKKGRKTRFEELREEKRTMIFYESPHKIGRFLKEASEYFGGDRKMALVREISKVYEEVLRGSIDEVRELHEKSAIRGEIVVIIAGFNGK